MAPRTIAALQLPHRYRDASGQLELTDELLGLARGAELAVLPECALTGYVSEAGEFNLRTFAEPIDGPTAKKLAALARKHRIALAGPLIEAAGAHVYNAFVVFDAAGQRLAHYRKRNPWMPETWATPGDLGTPVFEVAGIRTTIAICFDLHFLPADAPQQLAEADLLLFPSAWVDDSPDDARDTLLPQLALACDIAVLNANWGPGQPPVNGQGGSRLVSARGVTTRIKGQLLVAELQVP